MTRCDIVVQGLGVAGRALFRRLHAAGVDVVGHDAQLGWVRPDVKQGSQRQLYQNVSPLGVPCDLGLPCHLESPGRFLASMGKAGVELIATLAERRSAGRVPVDWVTPDDELPACRVLGLRAEATPYGFRLHDGVLVDEGPWSTVSADPAEGEITVHTDALAFGGVDRWLVDKVWPVRWQSVAIGAHPPPSATPPSPTPPSRTPPSSAPGAAARISRSATVFSVAGWLHGARWATPDMGIGQTERVPDRRVTATLLRLAEQDGFMPGPGPNARAEVVVESCDGLPIIGPIPGRAREAVLTGLGILPHTWLPLALDHLVAAMLGGADVRLPSCLGTARFR